jgi:hypothetical protein
MKLARVRHIRCGDRDHVDYATNYVWAADDVTPVQLDFWIKQAAKDCLEAERNVDGEKEPRYRTWWDFMAHADENKTIATLKKEYAAIEAACNEWKAKRDAARKDFAQRLADLSGGQLIRFFDGEFPLDAECDWGHNHGLRVDYGAMEL